MMPLTAKEEEKGWDSNRFYLDPDHLQRGLIFVTLVLLGYMVIKHFTGSADYVDANLVNGEKPRQKPAEREPGSESTIKSQ